MRPTYNRSSLSLTTQIQRFLITGILSAVVDFGLYWFVHSMFHLGFDYAKGLGFIAGTTTAYLINRRWTFQAVASGKRFGAVMGLYLLTFSVQVGINHMCLALFGSLPAKMVTAFVIAQGTATVINFFVQRTIIFRVP